MDRGIARGLRGPRIRNFHLPLPEDIYQELRDEATAMKQPATTLARRAIEDWLRERRKVALREAIAAYATEHAGSDADLDPALEAASLELWRSRKRRKR
jgi:hypothetical protein